LSYYNPTLPPNFGNYEAISVNWTVLDTLNIAYYDVYVRYGNSNSDWFEYYTSTSANSVLIPKGRTGVPMKVAILAKGISILDYGILRNSAYRQSLSGSTTSFLAESSSISV
jgi:hypothetical protein